MFKKLLSFVLAISLTLSIFPSVANASSTTTFSDFGPNNENYAEVMQMVDKGYINGYPDGTFKPNNSITRAEFVKVKGAGAIKRTINFNDVPRTNWEYQYVMYSGSDGVGNNNFNSTANITELEVIVFLWKDAGQPSSNLGQDLKNQVNTQVEAWGQPAVYWAFENGIIRNEDGRTDYVSNLGLSKNATRVTAVTYTYMAKTLNGELKQAILPPPLPPDPFPGKPYTEDEVVTTKERLWEVIQQVIHQFRVSVYIKISSEDILISKEELQASYNCRSVRLSSPDMSEGTLEAYYHFWYDSFDYVYYAYMYNDTSHLLGTDMKIYNKCVEIIKETMVTGMSDYEKAKAIHDYLCEYLVITETSLIPSYEPIITGVALPYDYASAYLLLANMAGLTCIEVFGTKLHYKHLWNMIQLDGKWYHLDTSADDDFYNRHGYMTSYHFLLDDSLMSTLHYTWDKDLYPACPEESGLWMP